MSGRDHPSDTGSRIHVGIASDDCSGIQYAVAPHFYMVSQHGPHLLQPGFNLLFSVLYNHQRLVALHVGSNGTGPHMGLEAHCLPHNYNEAPVLY